MTNGKMEYRSKSRRLQSWDYSTAGGYFVTICTKGHKSIFGKIENDVIQLSPCGKIVAKEWQKTGELRENVTLDEWVIMPNHFHGILILSNLVETPRRGVLNPSNWKSDSLGSIINQFKSACTRRIRKRHLKDFSWQSRYYDHVIRDDEELHRIQKYIYENPLKWSLDKYYTE